MKKLLLLVILISYQTAILRAQEDWDSWGDSGSENIELSLNGLEYIDGPWEDINTVFWSDQENFLIVQAASNGHIIAISLDENQASPSYYFYDIDEEGVVVSKQAIPNADFSVDNCFNLLEKKGIVYYYNSRKKKEVFAYDLNKQEHKSAKNKEIDWEKVDDWRAQYHLESPNKKYTIEFNDTHLVLKDNKTNKADTLINQEYIGDWSFGRGAWNQASDKFYFDNHGAVACIWEIDLNEKTLQKIVPKHEASDPVVGIDGKVIYCEDRLIKEAIPPNKN